MEHKVIISTVVLRCPRSFSPWCSRDILLFLNKNEHDEGFEPKYDKGDRGIWRPPCWLCMRADSRWHRAVQDAPCDTTLHGRESRGLHILVREIVREAGRELIEVSHSLQDRVSLYHQPVHISIRVLYICSAKLLFFFYIQIRDHACWTAVHYSLCCRRVWGEEVHQCCFMRRGLPGSLMPELRIQPYLWLQLLLRHRHPHDRFECTASVRVLLPPELSLFLHMLAQTDVRDRDRLTHMVWPKSTIATFSIYLASLLGDRITSDKIDKPVTKRAGDIALHPRLLKGLQFPHAYVYIPFIHFVTSYSSRFKLHAVASYDGQIDTYDHGMFVDRASLTLPSFYIWTQRDHIYIYIYKIFTFVLRYSKSFHYTWCLRDILLLLIDMDIGHGELRFWAELWRGRSWPTALML